MEPKMIHFEDLWNKAEEYFKSTDPSMSPSSILEEIKMKATLYQTITNNDKLSAEEKKKAKEMMFGRILSALTHLSLVEDINSFAALQTAIEDLSIMKLKNEYEK